LKLSDVVATLESKASEAQLTWEAALSRSETSDNFGGLATGMIKRYTSEIDDRYHHENPFDSMDTESRQKWQVWLSRIYWVLIFLGWSSDVFAVSFLPYGIWAALTGGELIFHAAMTWYFLSEIYTEYQIGSIGFIIFCVILQAIFGSTPSEESSKSAFEKFISTTTLVELELFIPFWILFFFLSFSVFWSYAEERTEYILKQLWREDYRPRPFSTFHLNGCFCTALATSLLQCSVKLTANSFYPNYHHGAWLFAGMLCIAMYLHTFMLKHITANLDETATIPIYTVMTNLCNVVYSHVLFNDTPARPYLFIISIHLTILALFVTTIVEDHEYRHAAIPVREAGHLCHNCGKIHNEVHDPHGMFACFAQVGIVPERIEADTMVPDLFESSVSSHTGTSELFSSDEEKQSKRLADYMENEDYGIDTKSLIKKISNERDANIMQLMRSSSSPLTSQNSIVSKQNSESGTAVKDEPN